MSILRCRLLAVLIAATLLAGCAQTAQTVRLSPEAPETGPPISDGQPIALEVLDRRSDEALGVLRNSDQLPAKITSETDVAYQLQLTAAKALRGYGFRPGLWSDDAEPRLLIEIVELRHEVGETVPRDISTNVTLHARAWQDGREYEVEASSSLSDISAVRPNAERNGEFIDRALTQALSRLLDKRLAAFLRGRG